MNQISPPTENTICIEVDELLEGYVLDALDVGERLFVDRYLTGCTEQMGRLVELERATDLVGLSVEQRAPRPDLWMAIERETLGVTPAAADPIALRPAPVPLSPRPRNVISIPRWQAWSGAVAAAILLVSTLSLAIALQQLDDDEDTLDDPVAAYVASGGRIVPLSTEPLAGGMPYIGQGSLILAEDMPPMLVLDRCTPSSEGVQYIVWLASGETRTPLGEMEIDENGRGMMQMENMSSFEGYDTIGISIVMEDDPALHDVMLGTPPAIEA